MIKVETKIINKTLENTQLYSYVYAMPYWSINLTKKNILFLHIIIKNLGIIIAEISFLFQITYKSSASTRYIFRVLECHK